MYVIAPAHLLLLYLAYTYMRTRVYKHQSTFERKVNNELMGDGSHDRINDYIITNLRGSAIAKSDVTKLEDEVKITDWNEVRRTKRRKYDSVIASCLSRDLVFELACICTSPCHEDFYRLTEKLRHWYYILESEYVSLDIPHATPL